MASLLARMGSRRTKWLVAAAWFLVIVVVFAANLPGKYTDAEKNESTSFLPGDAESTKALEATEQLQDGEQAPIVVVYRREGGLSAADRTRLQTDINRFNAERARRAITEPPFKATTPLSGPEISRDGTTAIVAGAITGDGEAETILDPIDRLRDMVSDPGGGLEVKVTGPAGFAADAIEIFESIDGTLLLAAVGIVFFLLILIYRSPIFFWIPLSAVVFAEIATRGVGYGLTELGVTVNGQSSSILSVLVLGAGTDYALLLVARYREELRKHQDKHEAMALALRTAGPAIVASGITVMAALLCLSVAEVNGTSGLGPIGALGIGVAVVSMLTLLPALLVIVGRRAFWPFVPRFGDVGTDETHGFWRRLGDRIAVRPRRVWVGTSALLLVMSLGMLNFSDGLTTANSYREKVESVEGQELLSKAFPGGANAPMDVVVPDPADVPAVTRALRNLEGVAAVFGAPNTKPGPAGTLINAALEVDPYTEEAFTLVPKVRQAVKRAGGSDVLVGGPSAVEHDLREASARDTKLIVPMTLVVVAVILIVVLRALVAPALLIYTVVLSFFAALGVSAVVWDVVFGFPGSDPSLPLFAFVFLVALGIDYNIFLMVRVREEAQSFGTRSGMIRGLAVTGGVITSAGIVLAGTFSVLAVLPLIFLTEIGFAIAFGVLLDTFIVRSILVPALVLDVGPKTWWPSRLTQLTGGKDEAGPAADLESETEPAAV